MPLLTHYMVGAPCDLAIKDHKYIITITLDEHNFSLHAADLVRENVEAGDELCYSRIAESQSLIFILVIHF